MGETRTLRINLYQLSWASEPTHSPALGEVFPGLPIQAAAHSKAGHPLPLWESLARLAVWPLSESSAEFSRDIKINLPALCGREEFEAWLSALNQACPLSSLNKYKKPTSPRQR